MESALSILLPKDGKCCCISIYLMPLTKSLAEQVFRVSVLLVLLPQVTMFLLLAGLSFGLATNFLSKF